MDQNEKRTELERKLCEYTVTHPHIRVMIGAPTPEQAEKTLREKFGFTDNQIDSLKKELKRGEGEEGQDNIPG